MRAAVLEESPSDLRIADLDIDAPKEGEVLVRVMAAGVCHSDYHYIAGDLQTPLPVVLGHEGAGVVEAIGPGVDSVAPGDHVIFLWRPSCGRPVGCQTDRPDFTAARRMFTIFSASPASPKSVSLSRKRSSAYRTTYP